MSERGQRCPTLPEYAAPSLRRDDIQSSDMVNIRPTSIARGSTRRELPVRDEDSLSPMGNKRKRLRHGTDLSDNLASRTITVDAEHFKRLNQELKRSQTVIETHKAENQKLAELQKNLEQQIEIVLKKVDFQEADVQRSHEQLKSYRIVNSDRAAEVAALEQEKADLEQKFDIIQQREKAKANAAFRALEDRMMQLQIQSKEQDENFRAAQDVIIQLRSSETADSSQSSKVTDNEIERRWKSLVFSVRQFVDTYAGDQSSLPPSQVELWNSLVSQPKCFFANADLYPFVLETHIWLFLSENIFSALSRGWGGKVGEKFYKFVEGARVNIAQNEQAYADLNDWRARSVDLICRLDQTRCTTNVRQTLKQIFEPQQDDNINEEQATKDMQDIYTCALELDLIFRKSKAMFTLRDITAYDPDSNTTYKHGFDYDPDTMNLHPNQNQRIPEGNAVDMMIHPALVKKGNADGANYATSKVLVKMTVVSYLCEDKAYWATGEADGDGPQMQHDTKLVTFRDQDKEMVQVSQEVEAETASEVGVKVYGRSAGHGETKIKQEIKARREDSN